MESVACDLCGDRETDLILQLKDLMHAVSDQEFTIVRCRRCGLVFLNPRPEVEEIHKFYPPQYYGPVVRQERTSIELFLKQCSAAIKKWIREDFYGYPAQKPTSIGRAIRKFMLWPEKQRRVFLGREALPWRGEGRLLDVGCGPGGNLVTFQEQGWDVQGVEMSEVAAHRASERIGRRIHQGTLETAPYQKEWFDVIHFSHSLEHMFSPQRALAHANALLKPGGMVVVTVPNAEALEVALFGWAWVHWDIPRHLYHFTWQTLTQMLKRTGFYVVRSRTGIGSIFFLASLERLWVRKFGRPLPFRWLVERLLAKPFCFLAGHLGRGTDLTTYAIKGESPAGR